MCRKEIPPVEDGEFVVVKALDYVARAGFVQQGAYGETGRKKTTSEKSGPHLFGCFVLVSTGPDNCS